MVEVNGAYKHVRYEKNLVQQYALMSNGTAFERRWSAEHSLNRSIWHSYGSKAGSFPLECMPPEISFNPSANHQPSPFSKKISPQRSIRQFNLNCISTSNFILISWEVCSPWLRSRLLKVELADISGAYIHGRDERTSLKSACNV